MRFSDVLRYRLCRDRLCHRRDIVLRTLAYLDRERSLLDTNSQSARRSALSQRKQLLDEIRSSYDAEANKIALVLDRLKRSPGSANQRHSKNILEFS